MRKPCPHRLFSTIDSISQQKKIELFLSLLIFKPKTRRYLSIENSHSRKNFQHYTEVTSSYCLLIEISIILTLFNFSTKAKLSKQSTPSLWVYSAINQLYTSYLSIRFIFYCKNPFMSFNFLRFGQFFNVPCPFEPLIHSLPPNFFIQGLFLTIWNTLKYIFHLKKLI